MSKVITKEEVVNNSNQPQNELFQIEKEIKRLRFEKGKVLSEFNTKISELENSQKELQINLFPIKRGDEIITKHMYKIYKINKKGKTDRSISYEMVDKDYVKGKVNYIFSSSIGNDCQIGLHFDIEDEGYTIDLLLNNEVSYSSPKFVSLDRFNELYEVVKN